MSLSMLASWFISSLTFGTIIMYGCLGETLNQKAGGLNLGTPGVMMLGGIGSILGSFAYESSTNNPNTFVCILVAMIGCVLFSLLGGLIYSFLTISLRCNQNVVGLTLTIFGSGVANFFGGVLMTLSGGVGQVALKTTSAAFKTKIPFLSSNLGIASELFFSYGFMFYLVIVIAFVLHFFLNKTRIGLNLRAVGENPATADACGINVTKYKYCAAIVGSIICGLGGLYYSMDYIMGTWNNDGAIEAIGWLALALVIFSSWKPLRSIWGSFLFGVCYWLYLYIPNFISKYLAALFNIPKTNYLTNLYKAIPYIVTILILVFVSKKSKDVNAPSSLGRNYFREER